MGSPNSGLKSGLSWELRQKERLPRQEKTLKL